MNSPLRLSLADKTKSVQRQCERFLNSQVAGHQPADYHLRTGGSRTRMKICIGASLSLGLSDSDAVRLSASIELMHNASLVHDDIQDHDPTRRGMEAVWSKFGHNVAICTGDYLITKAFGSLASVSCSGALPSLLEEMQQSVSETIYGQLEDLTTEEVTSAKQYEQIAARKAGPLLYLPLVLPLVASNEAVSVSIAKRSATNFAVAYQILDDLTDSVDDDSKSRPNLLNFYKQHNDSSTAFKLTVQRARYLLKSCERDFRKLPNDCAAGFLDKTIYLLGELERQTHESRHQ
jgi:geranylgeranyl diphosphate synthase type II